MGLDLSEHGSFGYPEHMKRREQEVWSEVDEKLHRN